MGKPVDETAGARYRRRPLTRFALQRVNVLVWASAQWPATLKRDPWDDDTPLRFVTHREAALVKREWQLQTVIEMGLEGYNWTVISKATSLRPIYILQDLYAGEVARLEHLIRHCTRPGAAERTWGKLFTVEDASRMLVGLDMLLEGQVVA